MDIDLEPIITESWQKLKSGSLEEALEGIFPYEKQAALSSNIPNLTLLLQQIINLCYEARDWTALNTQILSLTKKRAQFKQSISALIQLAIKILKQEQDLSITVPLIHALREVTLGKIFVEVERAHLTQMLSKIQENAGNVKEAAGVLFELQVETFGSMALQEKIGFLLEQMRLGLLVKDFIRTQIVSKKINIKALSGPEFVAQKALYYNMMVQLELHDKNYLECAKNYQKIIDSHSSVAGSEASDEAFLVETFKNVCLFTILSPFNNEQADFLARVSQNKLLDALPLYKDLLKAFTSKDLIKWPLIEKNYRDELSQSTAFASEQVSSQERWLELQDRVIEFNIRIVSKYYQRISLGALARLLHSDIASTELALAKLVINATIQAKLDRPAQVVNFLSNSSDTNAILNNWSRDVHSLLDLLVKTNQLIAKEEVVQQLAHSSSSAQTTLMMMATNAPNI